MKSVKDYYNGLEFNSLKHEYKVAGKKIKKSVSGVIKDFYTEFDSERISKAYALKHKLKQEDVLKSWKLTSDTACDLGTSVHLFGELYAKDRTLKPMYKQEKAIKEFYDTLPLGYEVADLEIQMYHKEYMFAGTADILLYNRNTKKYVIADFKTNKELDNNFGGKKLLKPFNNMLDSSFSKYTIQLSLYQILLEQTGIEIEDRILVHLGREGKLSLRKTDDVTSTLIEYLDKNYVNRGSNKQNTSIVF